VKVEYRKRFLKELASIPSPIRAHIESLVFAEIPAIDSITQSGNIEHLKGYKGYYKIRVGDYRIGLKLEGNTIIFERVMHRKEIYRYFP